MEEEDEEEDQSL